MVRETGEVEQGRDRRKERENVQNPLRECQVVNCLYFVYDNVYNDLTIDYLPGSQSFLLPVTKFHSL
jgi:hypothetical protein